MAEEKIIYTMSRLSKGFEKKPILKDISLSYFYGAKIGVLGLNGSGKSTLLKIMAGVDKQFEGDVSCVPGYSIGYLEQEPKLDPAKTVRECVEEGVAETRALLDEYDETFVALGETEDAAEQEKILARQGEIQEKLDASGAWELDSRIEMAMDALRCPDENALAGTLSGGEKRRVALCRLLLREPDILLLDEPTNHLDAETIDWLERHLHQYKGTVIAITHDRYFLDNVAGWILEIDRGYGIPWKGNYSSWLEQKEKRLAAEEKVASARRKTMERERQWAATSPSGRLAKNKARLRAYETMLAQDEREQEKTMEIFIPAGPRLGEKVLVAKDLTKGFGDRLLLDRVNFTLPAGGIVGVIGPNGAGKTTLFKMITGAEKPDAGTLTLGETVKLAYVDQSRDALDDAKPLWEVISDGNEIVELGRARVPARQYAARFGFTGAEQQKLVGSLSGGERNRVHLARMLKSGANVLLLDEPTNDLDVNTIRALEDALNAFAGCAVVITHDRWFLDRVATHILAFEGDSQIYWHEGNYSSYEAELRKRLGRDADRPHRIKYRRFAR
ncbi:energy-dependent translational throttle protein EttA [Candidatus Spyradosoma sp. SGI.093]|uniref:energy-dependent translational throttle protein EttA n=1 Tax=Candidatus Spyradosoma sp. SGI.093 TaxID=3420583 RepID=UPI003D04C69F